jgi:hypothetical protein
MHRLALRAAIVALATLVATCLSSGATVAPSIGSTPGGERARQ